MDDLKSIIGKVATGATLSREEAASAFDSMMSGEATPSQMGGLLMALRVRGETVDEITGAVSAMRGKMLRVRRPRTRSTWSAPAATVPVRSTSRPARPSSSRAPACRRQAWQPRTVLALGRGRRAGFLGVKIDLTPDQVGRCVAEAGIGFMFAPAHHPAMKNVGPPGSNSPPARSSICSARSPIRPA